MLMNIHYFRVRVEKQVKHKKYVGTDSEYSSTFDIALLKLAEEVDMKKYPPVCLPDSGDTFDGFKAWSYGENKVYFL